MKEASVQQRAKAFADEHCTGVYDYATVEKAFEAGAKWALGQAALAVREIPNKNAFGNYHLPDSFRAAVLDVIAEVNGDTPQSASYRPGVQHGGPLCSPPVTAEPPQDHQAGTEPPPETL